MADPQQLQQIQQQIQALQQQLAAVQQQQQQQQQPPPPPAVAFARAPAQVVQAGLLDYTNRQHVELHKEGSKALPGDQFNGTKLQQFLGKVES
jgi:hypothetical protein